MAEQDLLRAIDPYIQREDTGTAIIVFTDNSLSRVYLNAGAPTSARYRNLEGMGALDACKNMDVQTVKFHSDIDIVRSRVLLGSNYEVLEALRQAGPVADREPVRRPAAGAAAPVSPGPMLSPGNRRRLGALLADYIGPVAQLIMSDLPGSVDIESALSIVSREIDDTQQAAEFVAAARQMME